MSTWSLVRWAALLAGGELAVRGYLSGDRWICGGGAALFALALAALARPIRAQR
jgi:hypothetical protein